MLANAIATQEEVGAAVSALSDDYMNIRLLPSEEQLAELNSFSIKQRESIVAT